MTAQPPIKGHADPTPLSEEAQAARRPPPPDQLIDALQDRIHVFKGKLISSTPIRSKREVGLIAHPRDKSSS